MTENRLLDAIDELSKPTIEHIAQTNDAGEYLRTHTVEHPALLQQLSDAVVPSAGNDGGSKSASARERNIIDSDALFELMLIQNQLFEWCGLVKVVGDRHDLPATLRRWYVAYTALSKGDESEAWYVRELHRWARVITTRLDRSVKQIPTGYMCPLPECKSGFWIDAQGERQPARLVMFYRKDDDGRITDSRVVCQKCRTPWEGTDAIEELGEELREKTHTASGV